MIASCLYLMFYNRETHVSAPFWNDRMDRSYVCSKVRSLLAVFVAFEVLDDENEKPGRGKTIRETMD